MFILLDENIPEGVRALLTRHTVKTAADMGWDGISNGRLLDAAEKAEFELMVTADRSNGDRRPQYQNPAKPCWSQTGIGSDHHKSLGDDPGQHGSVAGGYRRGRGGGLRHRPVPEAATNPAREATFFGAVAAPTKATVRV